MSAILLYWRDFTNRLGMRITDQSFLRSRLPEYLCCKNHPVMWEEKDTPIDASDIAVGSRFRLVYWLVGWSPSDQLLVNTLQGSRCIIFWRVKVPVSARDLTYAYDGQIQDSKPAG